MAKILVDDQTYEFSDLFFGDDSNFQQIINFELGHDNEGEFCADFAIYDRRTSAITYHRAYIYFSSGNIFWYRSTDNKQTWTKEGELIHIDRATATRVGTVNLSDSYSSTIAAASGTAASPKALHDGLATKVNKSDISDSYAAAGTAANGKVPSQKALSDGLATKAASTINNVSTPSVTWATAGGVHSSNSVRRSGKVVEVSTVLRTSGNSSGDIITGLPAPANGGFYMVVVPYDGSTPFGFQLTAAGTLKRSGTNTTANKECDIHFTYVTSA